MQTFIISLLLMIMPILAVGISHKDQQGYSKSAGGYSMEAISRVNDGQGALINRWSPNKNIDSIDVGEKATGVENASSRGSVMGQENKVENTNNFQEARENSNSDTNKNQPTSTPIPTLIPTDIPIPTITYVPSPTYIPIPTVTVRPTKPVFPTATPTASVTPTKIPKPTTTPIKPIPTITPVPFPTVYPVPTGVITPYPCPTWPIVEQPITHTAGQLTKPILCLH